MKKSLLFLRNFVGLAVLLGMATTASAQLYSGPISSAIGGAGRAAIDPAESIFLNPAAIGHIENYFVNGIVSMNNQTAVGRQTDYVLVLADGTSDNILPGAFSFQYSKLDPNSGVGSVVQDYQIALAEAGGKGFSLGLSGHYMIIKTEDGTQIVQTNAHLGMIYVPWPFLGVGAVVYDMLPLNQDIPHHVRRQPTLGLGFHGIYEERFRARLDFVKPDKANHGERINVMTGIESFFSPHFAFRIGMQWQETENRNMLTAGLGFKGPRLSFDYTFQKDLRVEGDYRHMFDMWLPL